MAGTARTLVAVGTDSEASMFCTIRAATPRSGVVPAALAVGAFGAAAFSAAAGFVADLVAGFAVAGFAAVADLALVAGFAVVADLVTVAGFVAGGSASVVVAFAVDPVAAGAAGSCCPARSGVAALPSAGRGVAVPGVGR
ncbi:hypothetical protein TPA0907_00980 [Micromonospora humidisoli]|nr:hypothetical protein TPA0907_00980 [Micromonospora sp. AKA109]